MIHNSSVIDSKAKINKNVKIGPFCYVGPNVIIEENVELISNVHIEGNSTVGRGTRIFPFASIGTMPQDLKYKNEENSLLIGENNIIREYVSIHRSTKEDIPTKIFNNTMIMGNCHIGHDCLVGNNVIMSNASMLGGHTMLEEYVVLGANTLIHQHVRVGKLSMTAGGSRISKDVIPYMLVGRNPVKHYCLNKIGIKRYGVNNENYNVLEKAFRILKKGEDLSSIDPITEDLQYLISWFSVKSKRGYHSFI